MPLRPSRGPSLGVVLVSSAAAVLAILAVGIGIASLPTVVDDTGDPPAGPVSTATLRTRTTATSVEYRIPEDLQLRFEQSWSNRMALVAPEGDRGVVIADVTFFTIHDGGLRLAHTGEEFFDALDRSTHFEVLDQVPTELPNLVATQATVEAEPGPGSHIDLTGTSEVVDFSNPNLTLVAQINDRAVLIQVWAASEAMLEAWLPDAGRLLETLRLSPAAGSVRGLPLPRP